MCWLVGLNHPARFSSIRKLGLVNDIKLIGPVSDVSAFMNAIDVHVMSSASVKHFPMSSQGDGMWYTVRGN